MEKVLVFMGMDWNMEERARCLRDMKEALGDTYLIMAYWRQEPKFEVFYSKDVTHISLDELTEKIKKTLEPA